MTKRPTLQASDSLLFRKPAGDNSDLDAGTVRPIGVGLRQGTIDALDQLGAELDLSRGNLIKLAVRLLLLDVRAGKVNLADYVEEPPVPKKKIALPK